MVVVPEVRKSNGVPSLAHAHNETPILRTPDDRPQGNHARTPHARR
jgi:hypothetical protein